MRRSGLKSWPLLLVSAWFFMNGECWGEYFSKCCAESCIIACQPVHFLWRENTSVFQQVEERPLHRISTVFY